MWAGGGTGKVSCVSAVISLLLSVYWWLLASFAPLCSGLAGYWQGLMLHASALGASEHGVRFCCLRMLGTHRLATNGGTFNVVGSRDEIE